MCGKIKVAADRCQHHKDYTQLYHHTYQPNRGDHNPQAMFWITGAACVLTLFLNQKSKKTFSQDVTTWEDSWFIKKKKGEKYALWKSLPQPHLNGAFLNFILNSLKWVK